MFVGFKDAVKLAALTSEPDNVNENNDAVTFELTPLFKSVATLLMKTSASDVTLNVGCNIAATF